MITPLTTLKKLMRPAKGSLMVLNTTSAAGSVVGNATRGRLPRCYRWKRTQLPLRRHRLQRGSVHRKRRTLHWRRRIHLDEIEQMIGGHIGRAARKQHREDAVFADRFVQGGDQVLFGNGALGEKLLHQLVFAFGDQLHQGFMRGLRPAVQGGRESRP